MAKPWEKYQTVSKPETQAKPWEKYQAESTQGDTPGLLKTAISDLASITPEQQVSNVSEGLGSILEFIDKYTGAPVRKMSTELVTGKDLEKAPSGAEQAAMMGVSEEPMGESLGLPTWAGGGVSPSQVAGVPLEIVQDPFLLAQGALKVGKGIGGLAKAGKAARAAEMVQELPKSEIPITASATTTGGGMSFEQTGSPFEIRKPESLKELQSWRPPPGAGELPNKERLKAIQTILPDLENKPLEYHYKMFDNPKAMKELKLKFENLPTEDAKQIASYNQAMLDESANKLKQTINDINGGLEPKNVYDAGNDFIETVKLNYQGEKDRLGPLFENFKEFSTPLNPSDTQVLAMNITGNTKLGKLMVLDKETGNVRINPNITKSGMSDKEVSELSRVITDLSDGASFKEIQDMREYLRKSIDYANPAATEELSKARSIMLDQLEQMATNNPDPGVRSVFKDYAVNERARENVEKIIGGKIESLDSMYAANPDKVISKIFANPNHVDIVEKYVGPEKVMEMLSSKINHDLSSSYDSAGNFKPHSARNYIQKNKGFLDRTLGQDVTNRMSALSDNAYFARRFMDEVNPSGTAASLIEAISPKETMTKLFREPINTIANLTVGKYEQMQKQKEAQSWLDNVLKGLETDIAAQKTVIDKINNGSLKAFQFQIGAAPARIILDDNDKKKYIDELKNDSTMSIMEKALKRSEVNKTNAIEVKPVVSPVIEPPKVGIDSIAERLRKSK